MIGAFIEMHGHVFHRITGQKDLKMLNLARRNIINDATKQNIASTIGIKYFVFWDDQTDRWEGQLEEIYGISPKITIQEAENQVGKKLRSYSSI